MREALGNGRGGMFAPSSWTFAQPVWLSAVVAAAAGVAGVVWVQPTAFARWSPYGSATTVAEELEMGAHEVARMDDDAGAPWNGSLTLELLGGRG
jgi:hypothetical protein